MKNYFKYPIKDTFLTNGYEISMYKENNVNSVLAHQHEFYEFYLFISGDAKYNIEGNDIVLVPYTLLIIPPKTQHKMTITPSDKVYERIVLWTKKQFYIDALNSIVTKDAEQLSNLSEPIVLKLSQLSGKTVSSILQLLYYEQTRQEENLSDYYAKDTNASNYIRQLFIEIIRSQNEISKNTNFLQKIQSYVTTEIQNYVNSNIQEKLSIEEIAKHCGFSKYHLMRKYKAETGISLHQYILKMQLYNAINMMANNNNASLSAKSSGFTDYTTFFKAFKREYKMSPKEYLDIFSSKQ